MHTSILADHEKRINRNVNIAIILSAVFFFLLLLLVKNTGYMKSSVLLYAAILTFLTRFLHDSPYARFAKYIYAFIFAVAIQGLFLALGESPGVIYGNF